ncbi:hypothetical protein QA646_14650 [Rhizobium sp. CB3090]|uniref:hypothetical protein n=1 Tax=Rhizobium sp. CB3090 TaxID=3039156 RepID=UPI0024B21286|nr:hypothetical protein [Rhizobium sp. CB3090]WFU08524.1 hypothetical protein QA646_14650 [Rhizobium sp. CB3090]
MSKFLFVFLLACLIASSAGAEMPNFCKRSPNYNPGEPIDGRFMGVSYVIMMHAYAEKYCGAAHKSMRNKILQYIQKNGCGPDTEIYSDVEEWIAKGESFDLKQLVTEGRPNSHLSPKEVRKRAAMNVKELGGCSKLMKVHDATEEDLGRD